jgi:adenylate cyclase
MERKLTAILSADVKGYSRLMGEDEAATILTLNAYRQITDSLIHHHKGRVVGTAGDSILAEFASAVEAVQCAVEIQRELKAKNTELPEPRRMEFRIGINVGDVMVDGEQIHGDGVNIAARVEKLAEGDGIRRPGGTNSEEHCRAGAGVVGRSRRVITSKVTSRKSDSS